MTMEINGNYNHYKTDYAEPLKAQQEKAKETGEAQKDANRPEQSPVLYDEYISSEKSAEKPSGLYRMGQDENGNRKIFYDKPAEKCTVNTDKVDREIGKLKEKQQELQQQIRAASGNEKKVRELEKKLAHVE